MEINQISPAKLAKRKRNDKICHLFDVNRTHFALASELYRFIANECGISNVTVIKVLIANRRVKAKPRNNE